MDIEEMITLLDDWVYSRRNDRLEELQKAIIRQAWNDEKYDAMKVDGYTTGYVKTMVAPKLWTILSMVVGKNVGKKNLKLVLEPALEKRLQELASQQSQSALVANNIVSENMNPPQELDWGKIDWGEAPEFLDVYGRNEELNKLEKWIIKDKCKLVAILGISGIGKTALSVMLAEKIGDNFEKVFWRSLANSPSLGELITPIIKQLSNNQQRVLVQNETQLIAQLMNCLKRHRCLLILDEVENILSPGDSSGSYREGYHNYGDLLKQIGQQRHKSCLLITGRVPAAEIKELANPRGKVREMQLKGLQKEEAKQVLEDNGFPSSKDGIGQLIASYAAHPLALKMAAKTINNCHNGNIGEFLEGSSLFMDDNFVALLDKEFRYLSLLDKEILRQIAASDENNSTTKLIEKCKSPEGGTNEIRKSLSALLQRGLIDQLSTPTDEAIFTIEPVIKKYVNKGFS